MNETINNKALQRILESGGDDEAALQQEYKQGGYSLFSELLEGFRQLLLTAAEDDMEQVRAAIAKGRRIVPEPGAISPAWERIWDDYEHYVVYKSEALTAVTPDAREGEWQIVMDNPFTNEGISCYPGLSFVEAAYLYAYFRKDLKRNEYLRLQKITNLIITQGQ